MYHPYTRGKQYELLALRESAEVLADAHFVPIIEPVRKVLNGLERALTEPGPIVPVPRREAEYMGGQGMLEFFPWSAIVRMTKLFTFAEYEAAWDGRR